MVYFRFPFSDQIFTTEENAATDAVSFVSFDKMDELHFPGKITPISRKKFLEKEIFTECLTSDLKNFKEENQSSYEQKLDKVIAFIQENHLSKLVISRRKLLNFNDSKINLSQTFLNLCKSYPNAFVYFFIKDGACWLGAFSELLGKFDKKTRQFTTMSLAGTLPVEESWTDKEIDEQKPVTDFIKEILNTYSSTVQQSETYDHISGNIKHLRTDFKAEISADQVEKLIAELHPTPAICGIPKDICTQAIADFEEHPRKFYAGYIKVETEEFLYYFVNLRCAEFFKNAALIYVGGGITADSLPANEWRETELKSEALLKNLSFP